LLLGCLPLSAAKRNWKPKREIKRNPGDR
jgi:hypothetical protein